MENLMDIDRWEALIYKGFDDLNYDYSEGMSCASCIK